jgi:predicted HAD superfamily Cof-like phosphohydrolase
MSDMYKDVKEFHEKFGIPVAGKEPCRIPDYEILEYRFKFLEEELEEFRQAAENGNLVEMLDALADIAWVAMGTAHYFHAPWDEIWAEVKRSNNERVSVTRENCPPSKQYRRDMVMKGPDWSPPRIKEVIAAHNRQMKLWEDPSQLGVNEADTRHRGLIADVNLADKKHDLGCECDICNPTVANGR